jgi:hypothetical protein
MGQFAIYASPEGLVGIGPNMLKVLTEPLFNREDWTAYNPSSITGFMWEGMYVGFYNKGQVSISAITKATPAKITKAAHGLATGARILLTVSAGMTQLNGWVGTITVVDADNFTLDGVNSTAYTTFTAGTYAVVKGFMFDPKLENWVDLDFYATGGYHDPKTKILYLMVGANIVSFATVTGTPRTMDNVSRRDLFKQTIFSAIKVLATAYPVSVDLIFPGIPQTVTVSVTSAAPQRLPMTNAMVDAMDCRVYGTKGATVIYLASTIEELPQ